MPYCLKPQEVPDLDGLIAYLMARGLVSIAFTCHENGNINLGRLHNEKLF